MNDELSAVTGVLFEYPAAVDAQLLTHEKVLNHRLSDKALDNPLNNSSTNNAEPRLRATPLALGAKLPVAVLGAGVFGKALLIPALQKTKSIELHTLVTASGGNADYYGRKYGFAKVATDPKPLFGDPSIGAVFGLTPHRTHANLVRLALQTGTPLFIEKPLCTDFDELKLLEKEFAAFQQGQQTQAQCSTATPPTLPLIMVGHNRRYSPHTQQLRTWLAERKNPMVINLRVNAGFVPSDHWVHSDGEGRSRIIGEMTHFIDLAEYLVGSKVCQLYALRVSGNDVSSVNNDNLTANLKFTDGSIANLVYSASGYKGYSREHIECFFDGKTAELNDFRSSSLHASKTKKFKTSSQAIGYHEELAHFIAALRGEVIPPSLSEAFTTMRLALQLEQSLAEGAPITCHPTATPHPASNQGNNKSPPPSSLSHKASLENANDCSTSRSESRPTESSLEASSELKD